MKSFPKINQFYVLMAGLMLLLAVLVIVSLRGIFGALTIAGEVDESLLKSNVPRIETSKLDEAINSINERDFTPLDL